MFKKIRLWFCKHLGWHSPVNCHHSDKDPQQFLVYAECKICGFKGQIDSQGNLF